MNLNLETRSRGTPAMAAAPARAKQAVRGDAVADVHAFADRLLFSGWMEDNRRDQMKLHIIRAIVEWSQGSAGR